jgi:hypothetical protein
MHIGEALESEKEMMKYGPVPHEGDYNEGKSINILGRGNAARGSLCPGERTHRLSKYS